jgi:hypothetical protein
VVRTLRGVAFRDVALAFRELRLAPPASGHGIPTRADASRARAGGSRTCVAGSRACVAGSRTRVDGSRTCAHGTAEGWHCHFRARELNAHRASIGQQGLAIGIAGTLVESALSLFGRRRRSRRG